MFSTVRCSARRVGFWDGSICMYWYFLWHAHQILVNTLKIDLDDKIIISIRLDHLYKIQILRQKQKLPQDGTNSKAFYNFESKANCVGL